MTPRRTTARRATAAAGACTGRRALITGGDSGIGRAVALAFAREGADVAISHLPEEHGTPTRPSGHRGRGTQGRLAAGRPDRRAYCRELVERTVAELGGIDILVNNAAYQMAHEGLEDSPTEEIEHTFHTNIFAMFHICKAALEHMQPGSAIINTASEQAYDRRRRCWPTRRRRRRSSTSPRTSPSI